MYKSGKSNSSYFLKFVNISKRREHENPCGNSHTIDAFVKLLLRDVDLSAFLSTNCMKYVLLDIIESFTEYFWP